MDPLTESGRKEATPWQSPQGAAGESARTARIPGRMCACACKPHLAGPARQCSPTRHAQHGEALRCCIGCSRNRRRADDWPDRHNDSASSATRTGPADVGPVRRPCVHLLRPDAHDWRGFCRHDPGPPRRAHSRLRSMGWSVLHDPTCSWLHPIRGEHDGSAATRTCADLPPGPCGVVRRPAAGRQLCLVRGAPLERLGVRPRSQAGRRARLRRQLVPPLLHDLQEDPHMTECPRGNPIQPEDLTHDYPARPDWLTLGPSATTTRRAR
jgi:hypothetical protein